MIKQFFLLILAIFMTPLCAEEGPVVLLLSDKGHAYEQPLEQFKSRLNRKTEIYNLLGNIDRAPEKMQEIMARRPSLIFALGAKAAYFAKAATASNQDIPVIFAMVLNWQRYKLMENQQNMVGIDANIAPATQLFSLNLLFPKIKRIGTFYSAAYSEATVKKLQAAAKIIGVKIVADRVEKASGLKQAYQRLARKVDAVWIPADPVLYTLENTHWLKRQCIKDRMLCIGQSDNIAQLGMLLAINPDIPTIGGQAAAIAEDILKFGTQPANIGVQNPLGTRLTLNARTAKKIGLRIPEHALEIADKVIQ